MKKIILTTATAAFAIMMTACGNAANTAATPAANNAADTVTAADASTAATSDAVTSSPSHDYSNITLDAIIKANNLENLIKQYGRVACTSTLTDENGKTTMESSSIFYNGDNGMESQSHITMNGSEYWYTQKKAPSNPLASYVYSDSNGYCLSPVSPDNAAASLQNDFLISDHSDEIFDSIVEQDGALILTTHTTGENGVPCECYYFIEPGSLRLYSINYIRHIDDTRSAMLVRLYTYGDTVDTSKLKTKDVYSQLPAGNAPCRLTVAYISDDGTSKNVVYNTTQGISVCCNNTAYTMYTDAGDASTAAEHVPLNSSEVTVYMKR